MKKNSWRFFSILVFLLGTFACSHTADFTVGAKNFTEQAILAELVKQYLEAHTPLKIRVKKDLGGTFVCHKAIMAGEIDAYVEYSGTAYTAILKQKNSTDPQEVFELVKKEYEKNWQLLWLPPLGFNNSFAVIVRPDEAKKHGLKNISDLVKVQENFRAGFGYEFMERADGYQGMSRHYGFKFKQNPKIMDLGLLYQALKQHEADVIVGSGTDGLIAKLGLVVLEDDKKYFPPYHASLVLRQVSLKRHPQLKTLLENLSGKISETEMQDLNKQVDSDQQNINSVVKNFLSKKNLISL